MDLHSSNDKPAGATDSALPQIADCGASNERALFEVAWKERQRKDWISKGYPEAEFPLGWGLMFKAHAWDMWQARAIVSEAAIQDSQVDRLHAAVMNLPCKAREFDYSQSEHAAHMQGHKEARHAAADLICAAAAEAQP